MAQPSCGKDETWTYDESSKNIAETDDADQLSRLRIVGSLHNNQTMYPPYFDERKDGRKRVPRRACDYTWEIDRALFQRLGDVQVESLECTVPDQCLLVSLLPPLRSVS